MSSTLTRKIGNTVVSPIGFGALGMGHGMPVNLGPSISDEERFKLLDAAYEQGARHWDTADVYGDSEEFIGKWLSRTGKRDQIFLATKCGMTMKGAVGTPEYVRQQCEASLKKLGVDCIDLFYLHRVDGNTPIEVTISAMVNLIKEGKIKYIGLSECGISDLRRAHAVHPISALQMEYSPLWLSVERNGILDATKELGVTLVAYSPLGSGMITGQFKSPDDFGPGDFRLNVPRYSKENFPKIIAAVDKIREVANAHGATPGQISLSWLLAQSENIVLIPGTQKIKYIVENVGALKIKLSSEEIQAVRDICEESDRVIEGKRNPHVELFAGVESPPMQQ
ncbi:Aldo/keto reductase [Cylindrobasidium torrendii FP15055 ss-10]|uniref:Aldo/keto reductase n=1 Tax=Cylindrobasidium torrendii FP15055 ss-10 TaxID=1314674 RepID=A0A0D7BRC3_9AGAR|nr:Aldo/keto reductase [Cylindrobasidium torrendii FP15055 ss-10]